MKNLSDRHEQQLINRTVAREFEKDAAESRWLEAKVERLRAQLVLVQAHLYNPFEPDNQSQLYKDVSAVLAEAENERQR